MPYVIQHQEINRIILVIDITDPVSPASLSTTTLAQVGNFFHVVIQDTYLYVLTADGASSSISITDVSNPSTPINVYTSGAITNGINLFVQGRYMYVTEGNTSTANLVIYDVSNPYAPTISSTTPIPAGAGYVTPGPYGGTSVQGRFAYIAGNNNLTVIDVSNPGSGGPYQFFPTTSNIPNYASAILISGRYAYILETEVSGTGTYGFQVTDLGGAYLQELEVGSLETATLQTRGDAKINNNLEVKGAGAFERAFERGFYASAPSSIYPSSAPTGTASPPEPMPTLYLVGNSSSIFSTPLGLTGLTGTTGSFLVVDTYGNVAISSAPTGPTGSTGSTGATGPAGSFAIPLPIADGGTQFNQSFN